MLNQSQEQDGNNDIIPTAGIIHTHTHTHTHTERTGTVQEAGITGRET